jgi:hypothetical protein
MVELYHESEISTAQLPISNVERVTYKNVEDIPGLLRLDASPSESVRGWTFLRLETRVIH